MDTNAYKLYKVGVLVNNPPMITAVQNATVF